MQKIKQGDVAVHRLHGRRFRRGLAVAGGVRYRFKPGASSP
jgi:hypothetical protein